MTATGALGADTPRFGLGRAPRPTRRGSLSLRALQRAARRSVALARCENVVKARRSASLRTARRHRVVIWKTLPSGSMPSQNAMPPWWWTSRILTPAAISTPRMPSTSST